ncbi:MAG: ROK family protein [Clostridia bacterium]|nr:ROK family protein [Clostridia bacterium]
MEKRVKKVEIVKLYPECKDNIWGGEKLKKKYNKKTDKSPVAESWELSFHKDGCTRLEDGRTLKESVTEKDLGVNCNGFEFFPMLIKFIDAKDNLSVQVHPSDDYALKNENSFGNTEMWYIVEADEGAGIYLGFKKDVTKEEYERAIKENRLTELLNFYEVKAGECYFIPSGTIHAIATGCLICEIQQNSNLTYRVYDYGRTDKNGNQRELHVEKALKVTSLSAFENRKLCAQTPYGDIIGASKYFTTRTLDVHGEKQMKKSDKSFECVTCVKGSGTIDGKEMSLGDSFFVPAQTKGYTLKGEMTVVLADVRKFYVGIDLGGTFIKGGIVDSEGNVLIKDKTPTESEFGADRVAENVAKLVHGLLERLNMTKNDVVGIGMGVPGMIDSEQGVVIYSNNLRGEHFAIGGEVEKMTGLKVKIANDANVAALGEVVFGGAKNKKNVILLTLGTGVGGGIVADGKLIEGNKGAGAELGHAVIIAGGEQCTCGRKGCLEAYASATALIRDTKREMLQNPQSKMWEVGSLDKVDGETAFKYQAEDKSAKKVVDTYIERLAFGVTNFANIFRPEVVLLGGGVSAEGDNLVKPVQAIVDREIFAGDKGPGVKVDTAKLKNSAGILGAAALILSSEN